MCFCLLEPKTLLTSFGGVEPSKYANGLWKMVSTGKMRNFGWVVRSSGGGEQAFYTREVVLLLEFHESTPAGKDQPS